MLASQIQTNPKVFAAAPEGPVEQSFALQYTSLILILLTCIVGSFIRPQLPEPSIEKEIATVAFGTVEYKAFFKAGSDSIEQGAFEALVAILSSHDVHMKIATSGDINAERPIEQALSRSVALQRAFIRAEISPEAFSIVAKGSASTAQVKVDISSMSGTTQEYFR